ncbi:Alpha/Beta hydrolase protein [Lasiosphaeria hispida]|uniref:Alpha/Beta hydrolase protein n=1 Tax=Lasiosphaeria hispida TaxID=260671 RepID=A0AAJ0MH76_9PEZI|nr:Alpha/Beta hydrolase protein [Lasiosphaeria hispida]
MAIEQEGIFDAAGKSLYTKAWLPDGPPKAKLIFVHGFSDHIGRYQRMFTALAQRGIAVYGFDQRGWGHSVAKPSERGLTGPTSLVIADIVAFLKPHLPASAADPPVFVLGHSMGGAEVLTLLSDAAYQDDVVRHVRGWMLESPFVAIAPEEQPSALKVLAGRVAGKLLPNQQLYHQLKPENLSRDPAIVKDLAEDVLMHNTGTLGGMAGMLDRAASLVSGTVRPRGTAVRSLWLGHGTQDKAISYEASKKYFEQFTEAVPDKQLKTYEGWYHQLHADGECSDEFYKDVADWILARSGPAGEERADSKL